MAGILAIESRRVEFLDESQKDEIRDRKLPSAGAGGAIKIASAKIGRPV
jgi:hypothetical protein